MGLLEAQVAVLVAGMLFAAFLLVFAQRSFGGQIAHWLEQIDGQVMLLFVGMVFFACLLIFVEYRFQQDAVVFQAISNLASGFAGAFFGITTAAGKSSKPKPPESLPAVPPVTEPPVEPHS